MSGFNAWYFICATRAIERLQGQAREVRRQPNFRSNAPNIHPSKNSQRSFFSDRVLLSSTEYCGSGKVLRSLAAQVSFTSVRFPTIFTRRWQTSVLQIEMKAWR
jgi:hypothetical protein